MARKKRKGEISPGIKRFIEERFVLTPDSLLKVGAVLSGTYIIYSGCKALMEIQGAWVLDNFLKGKVTAPAWVLAKRMAGKSDEEIGQEAPVDVKLLAFSFLGSYIIVEHGPGLLQIGIPSILGLMK